MKDILRQLKEHLGIILLYSLVTAILTYPVVFRIKTDIPASTGSDAFQWMRGLWYTRIAIFNPDITTLTHDNLIFYPNGISTTPFPSAFNQIISVFLLPYLKLHIIYNILWFFSFVLSAYGAYLLIKYLTNDNMASFVSGVAFAFTPYHMGQAFIGHLGATTTQWIPFCALYLMKMFKDGSIKNSIFAGIFFVLVAMSDMQYMVYMGLFVGLLFIYEIFNAPLDKIIVTVKKYVFFSATLLPAVVILFSNDILVASSKENFLKPSFSDVIRFSADLSTFFLPFSHHPIFGEYAYSIFPNPTEGGYIGYAVIFLSILVFIRLRGSNEAKFWLISALSFSILSLGPVLKVNGNWKFTALDIVVPLPYQILYNLVPFLENSRTVGRMFVIAALSFSVLVGYGVSELRRSNHNRKHIIAVAFLFLIIFEYLCIPIPTSSISVPEFYRNLSFDKERYALLEIPATNDYYAGVDIIYYQTIHSKPIVGGQVARTPTGARDFEMNTPLINELTFFRPFKDITNQDISKIGLSILNYYNIRYVILHKNYMKNEEINYTNNLLQSSLKLNPIIDEKNSMLIYKIDKNPLRPFIIMNTGWSRLYYLSGTPTRWLHDDASIMVVSPDNHTDMLSLQVISLPRPSTLELYSGNDLTSRVAVPTSLIRMNIPVNLTKGTNFIRFHMPEGCVQSSDKSDQKNPDLECVSLGVQNITLSESKANLSPGTVIENVTLSGRKTAPIEYLWGFYEADNWSGTPTRWMQDEASIMVNSPMNNTANLSLQVLSFHRPRTIEIYTVNGLASRVAVLPTSFIRVSVPVNFTNGVNTVRFYVPEGCERPSDIPNLENPDSRCLSLAVQNITISEGKAAPLEYPSGTRDLKSTQDHRIHPVAVQNITISDRKATPLEYLSGFYNSDNWTGVQTRWMQANATIMIYSPMNHTANISVRVLSFYRSRTLEVYSGNELTSRSAIPINFINLSVAVNLTKGANVVRFYVPEGCERPSDIPELKNPDSRCLSLAIQNISISG